MQNTYVSGRTVQFAYINSSKSKTMEENSKERDLRRLIHNYMYKV